jgi:hypothetical protein
MRRVVARNVVICPIECQRQLVGFVLGTPLSVEVPEGQMKHTCIKKLLVPEENISVFMINIGLQ